MNIATVKYSEIVSTGNMNLSAEYHVNKSLDKHPYIMAGGRWVPVEDGGHRITKATYMSKVVAKRVNILLEKKERIEQQIAELVAEPEFRN